MYYYLAKFQSFLAKVLRRFSGNTGLKEEEEEHILWRRTDESLFPLPPRLCSTFLTAVRFLDLLQSDPRLDTRLQPLLHRGGEELRSLLVDVALFRGRYRDALHLLRELPVSVVDDDDDDDNGGGGGGSATAAEEECRHHLRSASVNLCLGDLPLAADGAIRAAARADRLRSSGSKGRGAGAGSGMVLRLGQRHQHQHHHHHHQQQQQQVRVYILEKISILQ